QLAQDADVIWASSDSIYGIIGYYLARCLRIPFVFDLLDNYEYFLLARLPLLKQMYRYVVCKSEAVTCVSTPLQNLVVSYGRLSDTYVVENATAPDVFKPLDQAVCRKELALPSEACLIGTAGHLAKNRGIKYLFHAFEILKQRHSDIYLVLAGPCAVTIPDDPRIHYLGFLPLEKAAVVMNALDVAVVCNQDNAFGRYCFPQKVREIMACDVPLVAAGVGSMQEVLRETPEWLYRMDSAASLAAAVENRLQDRRTGYGKVPVWTDHAGALEKILINVIHK
ncbi:MAG: glycosyltransferase family 4 protein, partial [bacterium]|nr:glycosyltransferase family 4 protein [bacterium]